MKIWLDLAEILLDIQKMEQRRREGKGGREEGEELYFFVMVNITQQCIKNLDFN